jgi:hypothetical protein
MADFLTILPNLSIGVVCIGALVYALVLFVKTLTTLISNHSRVMDERAQQHERAMEKREQALRDVETSVRNNLTEQMTKNTVALIEVTKIMGRVARHLDGDKE